MIKMAIFLQFALLLTFTTMFAGSGYIIVESLQTTKVCLEAGYGIAGPGIQSILIKYRGNSLQFVS